MKWVSVKDRLPKFDESVLLYWHGSIFIGYCQSFEDTYRFSDGHQDDIYNYVTHWMPLPDEPTEL